MLCSKEWVSAQCLLKTLQHDLFYALHPVSRLSNTARSGPGVPPKAIFSRFTLAKKKFKEDVASTAAEDAGTNNVATPTKKRPAASSKSNTPKKAKVSIKKEMKSEDNENEDCLAKLEPTTPLKTPTEKRTSTVASKSMTPTPNENSRTNSQETTTSQRSSARKADRMDYSRVHDPFMTMEGATNEDGENVFGSDNGASSEDSADSDVDVVESGVVDPTKEEDEEDDGGAEV